MASYSRKPNYHFKDKNSTGIDKVPAGRQIIIEDYDGDGSGKIKKFVKKGGATGASITSTTTMEEILNSDAVEGSGDLENSVMSKAQFEAMAEMRRNQFAGSGFVEFGKVYADYTNWGNKINEGMSTLDINSGWNSDIFYMGNTKHGDNPPSVNVNGYLHKLFGVGILNLENLDYFNEDLLNNIRFPEAPDAFVISDSSNLPQAMKQGDFAILNDLSRNIILDGTFENTNILNPYDNSRTNVSIVDNKLKVQVDDDNSNGYIALQVPIFKGKNYTLSFDYELSEDCKKIYMMTDYVSGLKDFSSTSNGSYTVTFKATNGNGDYQRIHFYSYDKDDKNNSYILLDNITLIESDETPIVALEDVDANIDIYENSDKFQARDSVSRQDLVFLESWHEDISEKGIVYPYGNVQYRGADTDSLSGISNGSFTGAGTYSLFGNWQNENDLVGKGYIWNNMSEQDKVKFVGNPDNNIYADGDKYIQVRYRIRVVKGLGNDWKNNWSKNYIGYYDNSMRMQICGQGQQILSKAFITSPSDCLFFGRRPSGEGVKIEQIGSFTGVKYGSETSSKEFGYTGQISALPIALVQRRNQGAFHPVYNPEGTAATWGNDGTEGRIWCSDEFHPEMNSILDCFNPETLGSDTDNKADGSIGFTKAYFNSTNNQAIRPDGLAYNEINERDVQDLRMNAEKKYLNSEILQKGLQDLINDKYRGSEGVWKTIKLPFNPVVEGTSIDGTNKAFKIKNYSDVGKIVIPSFKGEIIYTCVSNNNKVYQFMTGNNHNSYGSSLWWPHSNSGGSIYFFSGNHLSITGSWDMFSEDEVLTMYVSYRDSYTNSHVGLHCDIIGNPNKMPSKFMDELDKGKSIMGVPVVADKNTRSINLPDGSKDSFYLTYPTNGRVETKLILNCKSDNTFEKLDNRKQVYANSTSGSITITDLATDSCTMVFYDTRVHSPKTGSNEMTMLLKNEDVYISLGQVNSQHGGYINHQLIDKHGPGQSGRESGYSKIIQEFTYSNSFSSYGGPKHTPVSDHLNWGYCKNRSGIKVMNFLTKVNNKLCINFNFKEIRHNGDVDGDNEVFSNKSIAVTESNDDNGLPCVTGIKRIELPYFID